MSFVAPIPGLFAAVILTGLLVAPLLVPPLVLGTAAWLAFAGVHLAARLTSHAATRFLAHAAPSGRRPHRVYRARPGARRAGHHWSSQPFSSQM